MTKFFVTLFRFGIIGSLSLALQNFCLASHNRAGEITYQWVSGYTYKITIVTYTKDSSPADRCELEIAWGDDKIDTISRVNGIMNECAPINAYDGELIPDAADVRWNIYIGYHTYPGPGLYKITMQDPNRNEGVINMQNSYDTPFFLKTTFNIDNSNLGLDTNSSPVLLNPPIDNACSGKLFIHNPVASDINGDSISYLLSDCFEAIDDNGNVITAAGFYIPNNISLDPITGDLIWDTPPAVISPPYDEYNVCFEIIEWKYGGIIGRVLRDMQITIFECENNPPIISAADTCVLAGDIIDMVVSATDPDTNTINITLTASGGPLLLTNNPASFTIDTTLPATTGLFHWNTNCSHIRKQPYSVTFKADDNSTEVNLVDMKTIQITIVAPAPQNPLSSPLGNSINLSWDASLCTGALGYKVYRRNGSFPGIIQCPCETGVPSYTGYTQIVTLNGLNNTSYIDNNNGVGLIHGMDYCYRIVAFYADGAESCASAETCSQLKKDVPIITNVSVGITDKSSGLDTIVWSMPTEMDTGFTGPYHYNIFSSSDFTSAATLIDSTPINPVLKLTDTIFFNTGINTNDLPHSYRIELYSGNDTVGSTHVASSIYLSLTPSDNRLDLSWREEVPWTNYQYVVYKLNDITSIYDSMAATPFSSYADTGLVNGKTYCYYVKSIGYYSVAGIDSPLVNYSQISCAVPIDLTPPCAPDLGLTPECEKDRITLGWNNPNNSCADDVMLYNLYYTSLFGGDMKFLQTVNGAENTSLLLANLASIAGCYAATALDSVMNESQLSDTVCADNCPEYELPNVFSPDGNQINDYFTPFPYKYVDKIDIKIFDRWGQLIFETTDPDIKWNGKYQPNDRDVSESVYYYVCYVDMIRLTGIETKVLTGFVHLLRGKVPDNK